MTDTPAYIADPDSHATVTFPDGFAETVYADDPNFPKIIEAIKAEQWTDVRTLMLSERENLKTSIEAFDSERIVIEGGIVYLDGVELHSSLADRIVRMSQDGFNVKPMMNFLVNLMDNPSYRAVTELYGFLEKSRLPITDDGHFLAYKKIRADWTDCHTGTMDNSIGAVVEMPRNAVNDNRDETCSSGLHFCSREYLRSFGGARTVVVKINPADVVSIPSDYNEAKGRACRYVIVQEIDGAKARADGVLEDLHMAKPTTSAARLLYQLDPDTRAEIDIHDNLEAAADRTGIRAEYITRVLSGDRKSTGGYAWEWRDVAGYDLNDRSGSYWTEELIEDEFEDEDEDDWDDNDGWDYSDEDDDDDGRTSSLQDVKPPTTPWGRSSDYI